MNYFLHQQIVMSPVFWWNFISLLMLHLMVFSEKLDLLDPLQQIGTKSSCFGTGLVAGVDRLFLKGLATDWLDKSKWQPLVYFQQKPSLEYSWKNICEVKLTKCGNNSNPWCDCVQRGEVDFYLNLNITVKQQMNESLYRLFWTDTSGTGIQSEERQIPSVWKLETEVVNDGTKTVSLNKTGPCELSIKPNKPFAYCVRHLQRPHSIRILSMDKRQKQIVPYEVFTGDCVRAVEGFSESGGMLAYTETAGCQRRYGRLCSLAGHESPSHCEEKKKIVALYDVNNDLRWFDEKKNCFINWSCYSPQIHIKFCLLPLDHGYSLTMYNNKRVLNITNGPCVSTNRLYSPGQVTFKLESVCATSRLFKCTINATDCLAKVCFEQSGKASLNIVVNNKMIDLSKECSFTLQENEMVTMVVCVRNLLSPHHATVDLGKTMRVVRKFSKDCVIVYHTPSADTFVPYYQFTFKDMCRKRVTLRCLVTLRKVDLIKTVKDAGEPSSFTVIHGISIAVLSSLALIMIYLICLRETSLGQVTEVRYTVTENDEGEGDMIKEENEDAENSDNDSFKSEVMDMTEVAETVMKMMK